MSTQHQEAMKAINEMKAGIEPEIPAPRTDDQVFTVIGEPARPGKRKPVSGTLVERQFQRRNNINSLPGLIREHARLIAQTRNGEISLEKAEVLSRQYSRHKEMVNALEQRTQLAAIEEQLRALRGNPSQQLLIDDAQRANRGEFVPRDAAEDKVK